MPKISKYRKYSETKQKQSKTKLCMCQKSGLNLFAVFAWCFQFTVYIFTVCKIANFMSYKLQMYRPMFCTVHVTEGHRITCRSLEYRRTQKAHLHWQNPKSKKPGFFVVPFTLPEKPITFGFFGTKSAFAKKPESHTVFFLVSGAHAWLLSTFDRT